ncbi:MAG: hypothetical protein H6920_01325 [Sphingomonadaceae bacterium]|nr:hypothetical protein [Sphingomonadaceae bacterium]MCP5390256.1 hypothetical protein [Sphingomonadaceae bacterium]MCP5392412.1 hypothetical protein [Sphingomonadaceae bacterium]
MFRMMLVLLPVVATTLMGIAVIAVLSMDMNATWKPIALAAAGGFVVSVPFSWFVGKKIVAATGWG